MKKTLIFILTVITLLSVMALPVFADEGKQENTELSSQEPIITIGVDSAEDEVNDDININFTTDNISTSLEHMGLGMLGVILVLSLIALVVFVLNKLFKPQA